MSRWTPDPPDEDRYEVKPVDAADAPRDGEPWMQDGESWTDAIKRLEKKGLASVDLAEWAAHALIDALTTLEQELVKTQDLERAHFLKGLIKRHAQHADAVDLKASEVIDRIVERRR